MKRSTLAEQAYQELQKQIMSGHRPAGQRLLAEDLAEELSISQTPVKEALVLLERDGLVRGESRRGSVVRRFTPDDIVEIYDARLLLETFAVRSCLERGRLEAAVLTALVDIFTRQMAQATRQTKAGLEEAIKLDREFHEAIVGLARNSLVSGWHRMVLRQTQTIRTYSLQSYDVERARREHSAVIEALREGDPVAAVATLRAHLLASRGELLARAPDELPERPGV